MASERRLSEIADIRQGRYSPPQRMSDRASASTPIPVWGARGIIGFTDTPSYEFAVPLVTCRGNGCGLVQWTEGAANISNNAMAVVPLAAGPLDSRYLYYSLLDTDFGDVITGSAQPQITMGHLSAKPVSWTDDAEERAAIAHILSTLDDKIELNRRMNATLEAIARAIFKSWFVNFDPVRAKASGEPPESICRRLGLTPDLLALFPGRLVDTDLGEIPEGWVAERVDRLLELGYGKALKAADRVHGVVPVYGSGGITGFHNASIVDGPGVIVGRKGTVGSLYWEARPFYPIDTVFYLVPKVELTFCFYALQTLGLNTMNTDAAVPGLNRSNVYRLLLACPPGELRKEFDRIAGPIRQSMFVGQQESDSLTEIRDSLLPKLLSGELRVPLEGAA